MKYDVYVHFSDRYYLELASVGNWVCVLQYAKKLFETGKYTAVAVADSETQELLIAFGDVD